MNSLRGAATMGRGGDCIIGPSEVPGSSGLEYHSGYWSLRLQICSISWNLLEHRLPRFLGPPFVVVTKIPGASGWRCGCSSWSFWFGELPPMFPWFHHLHKAPSTNLQIYRCMDVSGILVWCAEIPLLVCGCPTCCNLEGKTKGATHSVMMLMSLLIFLKYNWYTTLYKFQV